MKRRLHVFFVFGFCILITSTTQARNKIREAFFDHYPAAVGSILDNTPTFTKHCGVCHYDFTGGGTRNPYGAEVEAQRDLGNDDATAIANIASNDSDGDGESNDTEVTDTTSFSNTPTFPGLTAGNIGSVSGVTLSEITDHLTPASGGPDTTPPTVEVTYPDGGESLTANTSATVTWTATDDGGIAGINIYVSLDNGSSYKPIALNIANSGSFIWFPGNRPTSDALIKVEAVDNALNEGEDTSDDPFDIVSPSGGIAPTTLRDFDQPGSQPLADSGLQQADPSGCATCHGGYDEAHEPYRNWLGSMMAHSSHDPLFKANMAIANQDAPDSGDLCLRCHNSRGWLDGRSTPTDGSQMTVADEIGVSCDLCHRLVDPVYKPGISPAEDFAILDELEEHDNVPTHPGNGMYVFDPLSHRRGPFDDSVSEHSDLHSPFHQEAAICGTCHDVSNPVFVRGGWGSEYETNTFDQASSTNSPYALMPVERTYSEWLHSAYNSSNGVFAPQFAGNKSGGMVSTCQDCHMSDVLAYGADTNQYPTAPWRPDMPHHDMTGGSSWLSRIMPTVTNFPHGPGSVGAIALTNGADRAEYMLHKAARMSATEDSGDLRVTVVNDTGHKLPTGYPEGRRMWINVRFYDDGDNLLDEFGGYDYSTGLLTNDTTVYEVHPGIGTNLASIIGLPPGPSFHFVLNNRIYEDNRIPPRGFTNSVFATFGGEPVGHHYDDGQYWDNTYFAIPEGAVRAHARLYYQSTSKEFIDFLLSENTTDNTGTNMYNLWVANNRCPPVLMTEAFWPENMIVHTPRQLPGGAMEVGLSSISGYTYWIEYADNLTGPEPIWKPFLSNGMIEAVGTSTLFTDDFTTATSGGGATNKHRFYRIQR